MGESRLMNSFGRLAIFVVLMAAPGLCGDWNKKAAADYLDSRQKEWFAWKVAKAPGGTCLSCHTGFTYLLVRPSLRRALGETGITAHETTNLDGLRSRIATTSVDGIYPAFAKEPVASQTVAVESIFAALFLAPESTQAFDRMWQLQVTEGPAKGSWQWFSLNLDPWEMPDSRYFG